MLLYNYFNILEKYKKMRVKYSYPLKMIEEMNTYAKTLALPDILKHIFKKESMLQTRKF